MSGFPEHETVLTPIPYDMTTLRDPGPRDLSPMANVSAALLQTHGLTKRFPGVLAVDDVDLAISPGEIVALLGQNGAGKSTVIQILSGVHPHGSYDGEIEIDGQPYAPANVSAAEDAGVVLIPQEVQAVPDLTVAENMFLNAEPGRLGIVDRLQRLVRAGEILREFDVDVDPQARMGALDLATQQLVVIARALSKRARLLILDEPTAALTECEAQRLFARMRALRARGVACVFVSHRLAEVFAIADRILVMRDGRLLGDHLTVETTRAKVVTEMIGGALAEIVASGPARESVALEVAGLTIYDADQPKRKRVDDVNFSLHEGEILGLFGLLGAGSGTVAEAIFGAWPGRVAGEIRLGGRAVAIEKPADAIARGVGLLAQDRRQALIHDHSVADNVVLASLPAISPHGVLDLDRKRLRTRALVDRLQIRAPSITTRVATLSGGNQQKVQVARWLAAGSRVLLLIDPTRGVDVGARAEINRLWQALAAEGYALLLVSSEAEELTEICDRVLVLRHGRLASEHRGERITVERLLHAAAGV
ncbi:MAG: sugar ABC transporter ATP-binding protein [Thermomicrobiales bacterium]